MLHIMCMAQSGLTRRTNKKMQKPSEQKRQETKKRPLFARFPVPGQLTGSHLNNLQFNCPTKSLTNKCDACHIYYLVTCTLKSSLLWSGRLKCSATRCPCSPLQVSSYPSKNICSSPPPHDLMLRRFSKSEMSHLSTASSLPCKSCIEFDTLNLIPSAF